MDIAELKKLLKLMNEYDLAELEIEEQGSAIRLRKASSGAGHVLPPALPAVASASAAPVAPPPPAAPTGPPPGTQEIRSPIVGTFYRTPNPEAPPFVNVGDRVNAETVVCIIEAMKVMNEIKAEVTGEVVEVLVENGEAVEFDQPLFRVKVD